MNKKIILIFITLLVIILSCNNTPPDYPYKDKDYSFLLNNFKQAIIELKGIKSKTFLLFDKIDANGRIYFDKNGKAKVYGDSSYLFIERLKSIDYNLSSIFKNISYKDKANLTYEKATEMVKENLKSRLLVERQTAYEAFLNEVDLDIHDHEEKFSSLLKEKGISEIYEKFLKELE